LRSLGLGDIVAEKYRIERIIGRGAMGVVVAARHVQLDQLVALKLVSGASDPSTVERFLREARAAARLRSHHVARVLDVAMLPDGSPYIVMEYLEGADLRQVLERDGTLSVETACDYIAQACEAVAEAHALGIVHRDIKPDNLYLTTHFTVEGFVKVLDFGISKLMTAQESALTQTRTFVGSPLYMAPEQLRSAREADARSDVWALGVVLFELLTRRYPFEADSLPDLCMKVTREPARSILELRDDLPEALVGVIERCLEKEPAARYANAAELATALAPYVPLQSLPVIEAARHVTRVTSADHSLPAVVRAGARPPRRPRLLWAAAGALLVAGVLALYGRGERKYDALARADGALLSIGVASSIGAISGPSTRSAGEVGSGGEANVGHGPTVPVATAAPAPTAGGRLPLRALTQPRAHTSATPTKHASDDIPAFR
jgi:serine/threonine-protein kinase